MNAPQPLDSLRQWRKRIGIRQSDLADALNVTRSLVGMWECGHAYPPLWAREALRRMSDGDVDLPTRPSPECLWKAGEAVKRWKRLRG
jgi:predicted transcriptional regulator